jgi:hypothetical protein
MKRVLAVLLAVAFATVSVAVLAAEKKPKAGGAGAEHKERPGLADLTLTGKIAKGEAAGSFVLVDADNNKIELPKPKAKGDEKAINLEDYLDQQVKIVAKGMEAKGEKKVPTVKQIVSVEKVAAAADAKAPAAGADAPKDAAK